MQQLFEKVPEFCVENCVDDGVESAIDVAEPRHHAHQRRWDMTVLTAGPQGVKDKEGSPAEQEGTCGNRRGERSDWSVLFLSLPDFLLIAIVSEFSGQFSQRLKLPGKSSLQRPADHQTRSAVQLSYLKIAPEFWATRKKEIPQTKVPACRLALQEQ